MDFTALFRQQVGRSTAGRHGVGPPSVPMLGIPIVLVTFNTCLRTHGPGDGNRNHIRGLEDRYSSR